MKTKSDLLRMGERLPSRGRIIEYVYRKVLHRPFVFTDLDGLMFEFDTTESYAHFIVSGTVLGDLALARYIKQVVRTGDTIVDVGANVGGMTLLAGKLVGSTGRVFAFEAESTNHRQLIHNIQLNHLSGWVSAFCKAVYSSEGTMELHIFPRGANRWNTLGWFELDGWAPVESEIVGSVTLDNFFHSQGIDHVDLLKIDTEGAEPEVLSGARNLLSQRLIDHIIFEVSQVPLQGLGHQVADILTPLASEGYSIWGLNADGSLRPVSEKEVQETFFANFVALSPICRRQIELRRQIQTMCPLNVVLGAGTTGFAGWLSTDKDTLDITSPRNWRKLFLPETIDRLLIEHVLEHLDDSQCQIALAGCHRYLKRNGLLRIAVPDEYRRDANYLAAVSPPQDGHKRLFSVDTLVPLVESAGFSARPIEYFDAAGEFHSTAWDEADGFVRRSARFDTREQFKRGNLCYTSLIIDATKL